MEKRRKRKVVVLIVSVTVILLHLLGLLTGLILTAAVVAGCLAALSLLSEDRKAQDWLRRASEWLRKEVQNL